MRLRALVLAASIATFSASAAEQLGTVAFPNSGKAEAQEPFLRGVLLLHNFAYPQAARAFVEAQQLDPAFALAYWGEAMTYNHALWHEIDVAAGRKALAKLPAEAPVTPRERGYVDAVTALYSGDSAGAEDRYAAAMERVARANADDVEAQAFWALSILGTLERDEADARKLVRAAAILEPLFPSRQDHPGILHYLIHAYDDPLLAPLGLRAARRYSTVASAAPHALHMPSHIFLQLGMWADAARSNEAAYMLSTEWVAREKATSDKRDLHSLEWLQYVYLQQRRLDEAKRLISEVAPKIGEGSREHHARDNMMARYAIETGDWSVLDLLDPHAPIQFARGMRGIARKEWDEAQKAIAMMRIANGDLHNMSRGVAEVQRNELIAALYSARGEKGEALRVAQLAVDAEEKLGIPSGPPDVFKPARELYGELLIAAGRKEDAAEQFRQSLLRTPNRALSLSGLAKAEAK